MFINVISVAAFRKINQMKKKTQNFVAVGISSYSQCHADEFCQISFLSFFMRHFIQCILNPTNKILTNL